MGQIDSKNKISNSAKNGSSKNSFLLSDVVIKLSILLLLLIITGLIIFFVISFYQKPETKIETKISQSEFIADLPPDGFLPETKTEEVSETAKIVDNAKSNAEVTNRENISDIKPADATLSAEDSADKELQKTIAQIKQFQNKRDTTNRSKTAGYVINYQEDDSDPVDYSIQNIDQFRNMDKDYSLQKMPTTITSKPVDLSRTLPMTETIPAILIDEIKSELQAEVVRVKIPEDVYAYHGNNILIPAGSIAIGRYKPLQKVGDTRLAINFYRVITPSGINIKISGFAADQEGSEGLTGELDNKNIEKFGGAAVVALLNTMAQLSINVESQQQKSIATAASDPLSQVMANIISQSINIAPTLRIGKGANLNIKFASDIWFPEPVANLITTVEL